MRVTRRRFQLRMPKKHLDNAHINVLLKQMGCKGVPQRARRNPFRQAGQLRGHVADAVQLAGRHRPDLVLARKQINVRPSDAVPVPQHFQELRREHDQPVFASLALLHADQHALAIDIADLKGRYFHRA